MSAIPRDIPELRDHARDIAEALDDAARARNHLEGILEAWGRMNRGELRAAIEAALLRLDGTWL
jgi:predicted lipid-binding transport protein (Tim44 family)